MAMHILEAVLGAGFFEDIKPENAKAHGVLADAKLTGRAVVADVEALWAACESPIETAMASALCCANWPGDVEIVPQYVLEPYRLDFLVASGEHKIDVECDGDLFHHHDIPMAQYRADRVRDRFVESQGISVIRFRGTDIWVNALGCADEVAALLGNLTEGAN